MRNSRKIRFQKGFGILEVLISSMILVTVVGAVVALGSASVRGGLTASDKTTAYNLVQECLETARGVRNTAWTDQDVTTSLDTGLTVPNISCPNISVGTPSVLYTRNVSVGSSWYTAVSPVASSDPTKLIKKVTVTVSWQSESGLKTLKGSTYLSDWKQIN